MTAKEYLCRLGVLDQKIRHKNQELREAKGRRGIHTESGNEVEDIQTSFTGPCGNQTEVQALRVVSLEEDIENRLIQYMELKHRMIDEIHDVNDSLFIDILYRRYVRNEKNFTQIACDMGYSYKYIVNKHGEALMAFERVHPELLSGEGP